MFQDNIYDSLTGLSYFGIHNKMKSELRLMSCWNEHQPTNGTVIPFCFSIYTISKLCYTCTFLTR